MSDLEMLLSAWLTDGTVPEDFKPNSDVEEYLLAIVNGVDDDLTPKNRADALLDAVATKYAGYKTGLTDLANALGIDPGTPQAMNEAVNGFNGFYKDDVESKGATGVAPDTLAILFAYSQLPQGGGEIFEGSAAAGTFAMIDVTSAATIGINITATAAAALTE